MVFASGLMLGSERSAAFSVNSALQGLLQTKLTNPCSCFLYVRVTHPLSFAVMRPPFGCPFHHMSLMHEVEDSHLSQPYVKHMWKLPALGSLSVLLNVVSGHPLCGVSFSCSTAAALVPNQLPCQSVGGISQSGMGVFTELRAVAERWVW